VDGLLLSKLVASLILPPGSIVVMLALGLAVCRWRPRLGLGLATAALGALYLLSTGAVAGALMAPLERSAVPEPARIAEFAPEAVVVLGGGRRSYAPEFGGETVSSKSLERVRYGARLQRETGLPLAVTGGTVSSDGEPEARLMARVLQEELGATVRWVEEHSRNTEQNAAFTRRLLEPEGVTRVLLVTHAAHMPRAAASFRAQGLYVLEAPTAFFTGGSGELRWNDWVPSPAH